MQRADLNQTRGPSRVSQQGGTTGSTDVDLVNQMSGSMALTALDLKLGATQRDLALGGVLGLLRAENYTARKVIASIADQDPSKN